MEFEFNDCFPLFCHKCEGTIYPFCINQLNPNKHVRFVLMRNNHKFNDE
jgi:hypothetical protein